MLAIGIDPGTLHLGWGVVLREGTRLRAIDHGVLHMKPGQALAPRLAAIADALSEIMATHKPSVASVESLFFHKDAQAAAKLGHARGVVLLCAERAGLRVAEYPPARVKMTVVGNGRADKSQVAHMVRAVLSLPDIPPHDAADALALAITELRIGSVARPLLALDTGARERVRRAVRARVVRGN